MKNRLRQSEKIAIKKQYEGSPFWKILIAPTKEYQRTLSHFRPSSEEVFYEVFCIIDCLKETADLEEARIYARGLFNDLFCNYRDLTDESTSENELNEVVAEVLYATAFCLNTTCRFRFNTLSSEILTSLNNILDLESLQQKFESSYFRLNCEEIVSAFQEYVISDQFISDEIDDLLSNLPEEEAGPSAQKKVNQFTNKQLIILFEALFEIMLSSEYENISHLADFISRVSGRSPDSIRQAIMAVGKKGCNKKDAKEVADVLKEFSKEKSKAILEDYIDN